MTHWNFTVIHNPSTSIHVQVQLLLLFGVSPNGAQEQGLGSSHSLLLLLQSTLGPQKSSKRQSA